VRDSGTQATASPVRPRPVNARAEVRVSTFRSRVTARGALLGMFVICLLACLLAAWRQLDTLAGAGFIAGCVLVPVYARREAMLHVMISVPAVFLLAEVVTQALTAQGSSSHGSVLSVLEGTFLTLADVAPWLLAGTALCAGIAMCRGLPQCMRKLRADLRGETGTTTPRRS
jgi:hypothetical protein